MIFSDLKFLPWESIDYIRPRFTSLLNLFLEYYNDALNNFLKNKGLEDTKLFEYNIEISLVIFFLIKRKLWQYVVSI